jgi:hypothetical protein
MIYVRFQIGVGSIIFHWFHWLSPLNNVHQINKGIQDISGPKYYLCELLNRYSTVVSLFQCIFMTFFFFTVLATSVSRYTNPIP